MAALSPTTFPPTFDPCMLRLEFSSALTLPRTVAAVRVQIAPGGTTTLSCVPLRAPMQAVSSAAAPGATTSTTSADVSRAKSASSLLTFLPFLLPAAVSRSLLAAAGFALGVEVSAALSQQSSYFKLLLQRPRRAFLPFRFRPQEACRQRSASRWGRRLPLRPLSLRENAPIPAADTGQTAPLQQKCAKCERYEPRAHSRRSFQAYARWSCTADGAIPRQIVSSSSSA